MAINPIFQRMQLLTGAPAIKKLNDIQVAIFGIGGVGSWAAEALVRSGVGAITIVDNDVVCITNVNRQLQATAKNVGRPKVDELKQRLELLSPQVKVTAIQKVYEPATADTFDLDRYDYVLDCIDNISCKTELIRRAHAGRPTLYSSMGAACKLDPTRIRIASVWDTRGCALARTVRRNLRAEGFDGDFQTVYSTEVLPPAEQAAPDSETRKVINGSAVHITATFSMFLAGLVIQDVVARTERI